MPPDALLQLAQEQTDTSGTSLRYKKFEAKVTLISKIVCVVTFIFPIIYETYFLTHCYYAEIYSGDSDHTYCAPSALIILALMIEVISYSLILTSMVVLFAFFICKARKEHEETFEKFQFRIIAYLASMLIYSIFSTFYYWKRTIDIQARTKDDSIETGRNFYEPGYILN